MANSAYYRFQHQKVTNHNYSTIADIKSLKPRVIFPNLPGLLPFSMLPKLPTLSYAKAYFFDSEDKYYKVWCTPLNLSISNATCHIVDQSDGSKLNSFGTGNTVATTIIHYDESCYTEYHCFVGTDGIRNVQIFNVISLTETLTENQIETITKKVVECGFDKKKIIVYQNLFKT